VSVSIRPHMLTYFLLMTGGNYGIIYYLYIFSTLVTSLEIEPGTLSVRVCVLKRKGAVLCVILMLYAMSSEGLSHFIAE
jgi:hypothetical protein